MKGPKKKPGNSWIKKQNEKKKLTDKKPIIGKKKGEVQRMIDDIEGRKRKKKNQREVGKLKIPSKFEGKQKPTPNRPTRPTKSKNRDSDLIFLTHP